MKLTSIVVFIASALLATGETERPKAATTPVSAPPVPKLVVVQTAKGNPADGWRTLKGLTGLRRYEITPEPVELIATEVDVHILRFSTDSAGGDAGKAKGGMIDSDTLLKAIKDAGFRPATIVEVLSVRKKLKDVDVSIYGNVAELAGRNHRFQIEFIPKPGQDSSEFSGGRVGLFPADWKWEQAAATVAAVKE
ncbi:MAG: hypothetical protein WCJ66_00280 [Verrucomicrobiota bacterium]